MEQNIIREQEPQAAASMSPDVVAPTAREIADEIIDAARAKADAASKAVAVEPHNLRKRKQPVVAKDQTEKRQKKTTRSTTPRKKQGEQRLTNVSLPRQKHYIFNRLTQRQQLLPTLPQPWCNSVRSRRLLRKKHASMPATTSSECTACTRTRRTYVTSRG